MRIANIYNRVQYVLVKPLFSWQAKENAERKSANWYWAIGILAVGGAVASIITANLLLALLILLGGFVVMVAGSRPNTEHHYAVSEKGFHIDSVIIAWSKIQRFAIEEHRGREILTLETTALGSTITMPLSGVNVSDLEMELKNRNIERVDTLESIAESITRSLGL